MANATDHDTDKTPTSGKGSSMNKEARKKQNKGVMIHKDLEQLGISSNLLSNIRPGNQSSNALGSYCSINLSHENYLLWKNLVLPVIKGNRLEWFITGTKKCPLEFVATGKGDDAELSENPEYENWVVQDQILLGWLYNFIEPDLAAEILGNETSKEL